MPKRDYSQPYTGTIVSAMRTTAKSSGAPQFRLVVKITDGPDGPVEPMNVDVWISLHENCRERVKRELQDMGFNGDFDQPGFTTEPLQWCYYNDEYNGVTSQKWVVYYQPKSKPLDASVSRQLSAWWKATAPSKPARTAAVKAPPTGDEIKF